ncbi:MAG: lipid asymmetry maintenance protein MlaB [Candidatus Berkiella sp.]
MKNLFSEKDIEVNFLDNELLIKGPLTQETVSVALSSSQPLIPSGQSFTLNLSGVNACDSASLAFVTALMRISLAKKTKIQLSHMPKEMIDLATVSGLNGFLPLQNK